MKTEVKKLEKSQVAIDFELSAEEFETYYQQALHHLQSHAKMDGFRKGHIPADVLEKKIGPENVLMEAGDIAARNVYPAFVEEQGIEPIGDPDVKVTKIAKGNPFLFTVTVTVLPEIQLPNYQEIVSKVKAKEVSVDEKELQETLEYLQRSRAKFTDKPEGAQKKDYIKIEYQNEHINGGKPIKDIFILGDAGFLPDFEDHLVGMKVGEEKDFTAKFPQNTPDKNLAGKEGKFHVKMLAVQTMELPEISDEFAKALGAFDNLVALKENLKEGITLEKKESEKQRRRGEMLEKISGQITFDIPEKMVDFEEQRLLDDLKNQVNSQFKISFEQYLASVKKTEEEIKKSYRVEAEKRIKNFLVLRQIGKQEKVEVSQEEIAQEVTRLTKNYSQEQLRQLDRNQLKEYSKGAIYNEKVFQILETFFESKS